MKTEYDIQIANSDKIDFMPLSEQAEILQNVITICTTVKGSVPMDRELGINPVIIDEPVNIAKAKISSEIIEAVRKFEPRARVSSVDFEKLNEDGKLVPHIKVRILL